MSIRSALGYSFGTRYATLGLQFLSTIIIARLLTPEDIGIYSVGAGVVMIAHALRDFGTSNYVIQEKELTRERLSAAFTLTVLIAWTLALGLWLLSQPLALFYKEPRVAEVMAVMAFNFMLIPFGSVSMALVRRAMDFRSVMWVGLASTVAQTGSAVFLAATGHGFISLAWAAVCGTLATVVSSMIANPSGFFLKPSLAEIRHILKFSLRSSAASIASEAGHASPDLVLGRTVGMEGTGLFSRTMGYVQLFERLLQDVLRSVMLPYLAGAEREGRDMRAQLIQVLDNVVSVSLFIIGLTAALAQPAIVLLYGTQWEAVIPLAQLLCIAMILRCTFPTLGAALVARGQVGVLMNIQIIATASKFALLIPTSYFGLTYGVIGFTAAEGLNLILLLHYARRSQLFSWRDLLPIYIRNVPIAALGILPSALIVQLQAPPEQPLALLIYLSAAGLMSCGAWFAALMAFDRPPKQELLSLFRVIKKKFA